MALSWSLDTHIIAESQFALGKLTAAGERGRIAHIATASDDTGTALLAVAAVEGTFGTAHPSMSGVPYLNVAVQKVGPRKWKVVQFFGWGPDSRWGGSSATTVVAYRLRSVNVPCYTIGTPEADGLPATSGTWYSIVSAYDPTVAPRPYMFEMSVIHIRVPVRTNTNPVNSTIVGLRGKVNNATVTILSANATPVSFGAGELRFIGADIDSRINSTHTFVGTMDFVAAPSWKVMSVRFTSGSWAATKTTNLDSGNFSAFSSFGLT